MTQDVNTREDPQSGKKMIPGGYTGRTGKKKDYLGYKVVTQSPEMLLEVLPTGVQVSHVVQIRGANSGS